MAKAPSWVAGKEEREPPKEPIGVRAAATITTAFRGEGSVLDIVQDEEEVKEKMGSSC